MLLQHVTFEMPHSSYVTKWKIQFVANDNLQEIAKKRKVFVDYLVEAATIQIKPCVVC